MEWEEVEPARDGWLKQINLTAYYGEIVIGSIVFCGDEIGWQSVVDGVMDFMLAETEQDAKKELIEMLDSYFEGAIRECEQYRDMLDELAFNQLHICRRQ